MSEIKDGWEHGERGFVLPKVGTVVYGVSYQGGSRPGALKFLTHTQDHITDDKDKAIAEATRREVRDGYYDAGQTLPKYKTVPDPHLEESLIVWEMRRIR